MKPKPLKGYKDRIMKELSKYAANSKQPITYAEGTVISSVLNQVDGEIKSACEYFIVLCESKGQDYISLGNIKQYQKEAFEDINK